MRNDAFNLLQHKIVSTYKALFSTTSFFTTADIILPSDKNGNCCGFVIKVPMILAPHSHPTILNPFRPFSPPSLLSKKKLSSIRRLKFNKTSAFQFELGARRWKKWTNAHLALIHLSSCQIVGLSITLFDLTHLYSSQ